MIFRFKLAYRVERTADSEEVGAYCIRPFSVERIHLVCWLVS